MPKMVQIHHLTLKPDTNIEEFETFVVEELSQFVWDEGSSHQIVKYVKGVKSTEYILIFQLSEAYYNATNTEEKRQKYYDERNKIYPENPKLREKLRSYTVDLFGEGTSTHYHALS